MSAQNDYLKMLVGQLEMASSTIETLGIDAQAKQAVDAAARNLRAILNGERVAPDANHGRVATDNARVQRNGRIVGFNDEFDREPEGWDDEDGEYEREEEEARQEHIERRFAEFGTATPRDAAIIEQQAELGTPVEVVQDDDGNVAATLAGFRETADGRVVSVGSTVDDLIDIAEDRLGDEEDEDLADEETPAFTVVYTRKDGDELTIEDVREILQHPVVKRGMEEFGELVQMPTQADPDGDLATKRVNFFVAGGGKITTRHLAAGLRYGGTLPFPGIGLVEASMQINYGY